MSSAAWNAVFSNLTTDMGSTWGSLVQEFDQDASYLGSLGENVSDVNQLWSLEVQRANGLGPMQDLATSTDISVTAPGLALAVERSFSANVIPRNILGPFGFGWAIGGAWGETLTVQSGGTVVITQADGSNLDFTANANGYASPQGDYDMLANLGGGVFTLTQVNGQGTDFVNGQVAFVQDADGNRITAGYNGTLLTSLTDSSGQWIDLNYNSSGRVTKLTNSAGQTTAYSYDSTNQFLLSATQYLSAGDTVGYTTSYTYDTSAANAVLANTLLSVTAPDGTQQSFSYDNEGRLSQSYLNGGAQTMTYAYSEGQVTATNADGDSTVFSYNEFGLLASLTDALGTTTYQYDSNGNLLKATDPAQQSYVYAYDALGQLIQSTDPNNDVTQFTYGPLDTLTSVTDPDRNKTRYGYDSNGDQTSTLYADGTLESNAFNPIGELLGSTDGNDTVTNYTYNAGPARTLRSCGKIGVALLCVTWYTMVSVFLVFGLDWSTNDGNRGSIGFEGGLAAFQGIGRPPVVGEPAASA